MKTRPCKYCGENKDKNFYFNKTGKRYWLCKSCASKRRKKQRPAIKEKEMSNKEIDKYIETHPINRNLIKNAFAFYFRSEV